jgi:hypothetical protein
VGKRGVRDVNASGKIITFVNLPIVVTVFILVAKAKVNSTTFQDATASFSIELLTGFVNQVILLPVMYVFMTFVAAVTPLQLGDRIDNAPVWRASMRGPEQGLSLRRVPFTCDQRGEMTDEYPPASQRPGKRGVNSTNNKP